MAVTSGFFNALNKDRMYNSEQMSTIFDGIIRDGIFASIGTCLVVEASTGLNVAVGIGKAWFNHTWTLNDAILPLTADLSDVLFDRVDAVILEVNNTESVRDNTIKFIKGTASSTPILPDLIETEHVHQHVLAYVYRPANSTVITAVNITNMVGSVQTPFITGVLDVISVDEILGQWRAELDLFVDTEEADFTTWYNGMKATMEDVAAELNIWTAAQQAEILAWFDDMKNQLSTDAAANLQLQINELEDVVGDSIFIGTQGDITPTIPSNADMLGNQLPAYYAKQTAVDTIDDKVDTINANYDYANPITVTTFPYTALRDGLFRVDIPAHASGGYGDIKVNGPVVATGLSNASFGAAITFPVKKGDIITSASYTVTTIKRINYKLE